MTEPSTFTAVDLLRLPAPTIGETLNLDTLQGQLQTLLPTSDGPAESESVVKLLKFAAYRKMLPPARVNAAARAVMPACAIGADLDNLAALMSAKLLLITPGNMQANAPPVCAGDADFRRCQHRALEGYSGTRPEGAYIFQALSAAFDLLDASATIPTAGEVRITVLSRVRKSTRAPTLLNTVLAYVSAETSRSLTDQSVQTARPAVPASITTVARCDGSPAHSLQRQPRSLAWLRPQRCGRRSPAWMPRSRPPVQIRDRIAALYDVEYRKEAA